MAVPLYGLLLLWELLKFSCAFKSEKQLEEIYLLSYTLWLFLFLFPMKNEMSKLTITLSGYDNI